MILSITNTKKPATDLSFLLHKHPEKFQSVELSHGKAHIFYPEGYKAAEIPALTGRMTYPLKRRPYIGPTADDVIIIAPGLISPWAKLYDKPMTVDERNIIINSVRQEIKQKCPQVIFENDYYMICALE